MRGCQKRVVFLKNTGSPVFEEAYFIVRDRETGIDAKKDIVSEASRIVDEMLGKRKGGTRERLIYVATFMLGAALGCVLTVIFH